MKAMKKAEIHFSYHPLRLLYTRRQDERHAHGKVHTKATIHPRTTYVWTSLVTPKSDDDGANPKTADAVAKISATERTDFMMIDLLLVELYGVVVS